MRYDRIADRIISELSLKDNSNLNRQQQLELIKPIIKNEIEYAEKSTKHKTLKSCVDVLEGLRLNCKK